MTDQITLKDRRLGPIAEAANAGIVVLPAPMLEAAATADRLTQAAREAEAAALAARSTAQDVEDATIKRMATFGPIGDPSAPSRASLTAAEALDADGGYYSRAAAGAERAIARSWLDGVVDVAHQLVDGLAGVLDAARADAAVLARAGVDYSDPDSIHDASKAAQAAWHNLEPLAAKHDAIRRAGLALRDDLHVGHVADQVRRQALMRELDTAASTRGERQTPLDEWLAGLALAGALMGPAPRFVGTGDPRLAPRWQWSPGAEHPVARLVRTALAPPDAEPPEEPEEPPAKPVQRVPIRPVAALLRR